MIYIPYLGKPIRGEVLRLREQDFIDAARVQGMGPLRIMMSEILPNAAKEMTEPLKTKLKPYELPDWQNATAEIQITSPQ